MSRIDVAEGRFTVDADLVSAAFGLEPADVPALMRAGGITSRCETGIEEDAGRWRLTFYHGGRALRLTVDSGGRVLKRATFDAPDHGAGKR